MKGAAYNISTVFGLGDRLPAPGTTAGSAPVALIFFLLLYEFSGNPLLGVFLVVAVITAIIAGIWAAEEERLRRGIEDPGPIVIDEVAGQLICYLCGIFVFDAFGLGSLPFSSLPFSRLIFVLAGFFLFRFFDILKPWPVNRLERLPGGFGIMADDLAAGLYAGIAFVVLWSAGCLVLVGQTGIGG